MKNQVKNKAIILNEENKILVFIKESGKHQIPTVHYPTITPYSSIELLKESSLDQYEYLTSFMISEVECECKNGHLIKTKVNKKSNYYIRVHSLTDEEIRYFVDLGCEQQTKPYFLTTEEIRELIENWYYSFGNLTYSMEKKLAPIEELEKKTPKNYVRQLGKEDKNVRYKI